MAHYYFAYGSNINIRQMANRCPLAEYVGNGTLNDWQFLINERGVASIAREVGQNVIGALYSITPFDEARLDHYEGVSLGYYGKFQLPIKIKNKTVRALVYIDPDREFGTPRPGYFAKIYEGALDREFPDDYIEELCHWEDSIFIW